MDVCSLFEDIELREAGAQACLLEILKQPLLTLQALLAYIAGYVTQFLPVATLENVARMVASPAALFGPLDWLQGCLRRIASRWS